ncbi:hypothetical protein [Nonomuraea endophytica]|uniref:Uncharacterized protein n=1 Tax=Nonomuraea endophytica TaxID=714136 RepID=A0A7W8AA00_9ACTN|nr:hypothetical protein [Nonomuraea endophytica]MBB5081380.1 hypothetical protein [Nonomuraea endophytica]
MDGTAVSWADLLQRWALVEADLHSEYGVDVDQPGLLLTRTWRWLRVRILGLLSADTRTARSLTPEDRHHRR